MIHHPQKMIKTDTMAQERKLKICHNQHCTYEGTFRRMQPQHNKIEGNAKDLEGNAKDQHALTHQQGKG